MKKIRLTVLSRPRRYFSGLLAALLILCNVAVAAQVIFPKVQRGSAHYTVAPELHSAPIAQSPAHGLRETSAEEIQRIEQLTGRNIVPRHFASFLWNWFPDVVAATVFCKPLLLLEDARINAKIIALSHTNLNSRYPIPPPATLL